MKRPVMRLSTQPQPLLLTNQMRSPFLGSPPGFGHAHYIGRQTIGIMRCLRGRRERWCFTHRIDSSPCFGRWFDEVSHFHNGYARVREGDSWWFVNQQGKDACRHHFIDTGEVDADGFVSVLHHSAGHRGDRKWQTFHLPTKRFV